VERFVHFEDGTTHVSWLHTSILSQRALNLDGYCDLTNKWKLEYHESVQMRLFEGF
jgi:hypothetical protein